MSGMSLKGEELKVRTEGETLEGGGGYVQCVVANRGQGGQIPYMQWIRTD